MDSLIGMGFDEHTVSYALRKANGNISEALELLLQGISVSPVDLPRDSIVELPCSQYSYDAGDSACTTIALSVGFSILRDFKTLGFINKNENALIDYMLSGILFYSNCPSFEKGFHTSIDEVWREMRSSQKDIVMLDSLPVQGLLPFKNCFHRLFDFLLKSSDHFLPLFIAITKPPETVGVVVLPKNFSKRFFLFDSHSRPDLNIHGAYLFSCNDCDDLIKQLDFIFPELKDMIDVDPHFVATYNTVELVGFQLCDHDCYSEEKTVPSEVVLTDSYALRLKKSIPNSGVENDSPITSPVEESINPSVVADRDNHADQYSGATEDKEELESNESFEGEYECYVVNDENLSEVNSSEQLVACSPDVSNERYVEKCCDEIDANDARDFNIVNDENLSEVNSSEQLVACSPDESNDRYVEKCCDEIDANAACVFVDGNEIELSLPNEFNSTGDDPHLEQQCCIDECQEDCDDQVQEPRKSDDDWEIV